LTAASANAVRWTGLAIILATACVRALTTISELPGWDLDPSLIDAPLGGVGPAASMWLDALLLLGSSLTFVGEALLGRRPVWWSLALALAGCVPVLAHGWLIGGGSFEQARIGAAWAAGIIAATALWHACRDDAPRRVAAAVLLGIVAVFFLKGLHQLFIEHPRTLAEYEANRDVFLAAQGWSPDSPMARTYERRLRQPEASGWFGLANVYATFAAAGAVALGAMTAGLLRAPRRPGPLIGASLLTVLAAAGLVMSGAKGGFIAAAAGGAATAALAAITLAPHLPRRTLIAAAIAVAAVAGPIALIILRGQLGEDALGGDRSLLFRWFYAEAAGRIAADHPLLGVGPAGFQDAYLLAKNPLSPEDVRSPHSLLLDWPSTLGLFGLAWVALFIGWLTRAAIAAVRPPDPAPPPPAPEDTRTELRVALLACAAAIIVATWFDRRHTTPDAALIRVGSLAIWCAATWAIARAAAARPGILPLALAGGALTAAAHGQIDVAGSWPQSAALFLALIAASGAPPTPASSPTPSRLNFAPGLIACLLAVFLVVAGALPAQRWERDLHDAANHARTLAQVNDLLTQTRSTDPAAALRARTDLLSLLTTALGRRVEPTSASVEAALTDLEVRVSLAAADRLASAADRDLSDWRPRREASRMLARAATALARSGRRTDSAATFDRAVEILGGPADPAAASENRPATQFAWLAVIYRTRHEALADAAALRGAVAALFVADTKDPTNPDHAARLALTLRALGDLDAARDWARRALDRERLARLDPEARGFSDQQRAALRALAGEP